MKQATLAIVATLVMLGISVNGTAFPTPTRCAVLRYVPFSFQVAGRDLPAGYYRFEQVLGNSDGFEILVVRSLDGHFYQAVAARVEKMDETQPASRIVFRRSREHLVLAGVCSRSKQASIGLYDSGSKQPILAERTGTDDEVVLAVPSDGELLAMARSR